MVTQGMLLREIGRQGCRANATQNKANLPKVLDAVVATTASALSAHTHRSTSSSSHLRRRASSPSTHALARSSIQAHPASPKGSGKKTHHAGSYTDLSTRTRDTRVSLEVRNKRDAGRVAGRAGEERGIGTACSVSPRRGLFLPNI